MKAPACSTLPSILAATLAASCTAPEHTPISTSPVAGLDRHTGVIVESEGNTITVLIGDQLAKISLEGFAAEGREVAASVARRSDHTTRKAPR